MPPVDVDLSPLAASLEQIPWLQPLTEYVFFGNSVAAYLVAAVFVVAVWALAKSLLWLLKSQARRLTKFTRNDFDDAVLETVRRSLTMILVLAAVYVAVQSLILPERVDKFIVDAIFVLVTVKITYELEQFMTYMIKNYLEPLAKRNKGSMKTFIPTLLRASKFIFWTLAFLLVLSNLGYNIASLIAGLGLGGLAIALAAQETLSNFFGSISILTDQPFKTGDYVKVQGYSGTVKEVGIRSTKIQTLDRSIVSIPNKMMASSVLENVSRRNMMKVEQVIGLEFGLSLQSLEKLLDKIRAILRKDPAIDTDSARVHFLTFGEDSLEITIFYYITENKDYKHALDIRQGINLKIKRAFERMGAQIAYPTQSLYHQNAKSKSSTRSRKKTRK